MTLEGECGSHIESNPLNSTSYLEKKRQSLQVEKDDIPILFCGQKETQVLVVLSSKEVCATIFQGKSTWIRGRIWRNKTTEILRDLDCFFLLDCLQNLLAPLIILQSRKESCDGVFGFCR